MQISNVVSIFALAIVNNNPLHYWPADIYGIQGEEIILHPSSTDPSLKPFRLSEAHNL